MEVMVSILPDVPFILKEGVFEIPNLTYVDFLTIKNLILNFTSITENRVILGPPHCPCAIGITTFGAAQFNIKIRV